MTKIQNFKKIFWSFEHWILEFIWSLGFGTWDLRPEIVETIPDNSTLRIKG